MYIKVSSVKKDFQIFEKLFFQSSLLENNNFYALLDLPKVDQFFSNSLKKNPLKNFNLDKKFLYFINELIKILNIKNFNFSNFSNFKSVEDLLYAFLLLFLLKTFSLKPKKSKKFNLEFEISSVKDILFDRNDFINCFVDYLLKFFIFNEIINNSLFTLNKQELRNFSFRFIELCVKEDLILLKDIKTGKRHYKLLEFRLFLIPNCPEIALYTEKFNVYVRSGNEPYLYNSHFSSIFLITKQATYSNSVFRVPFEQIDLLTQRGAYVDRHLLECAFISLLNDQGLNKDSDLMKIFEDFSSKIAIFIKEGDLHSLKTYHSKLSHILTLIRIKTILSADFDNKKLYLPFMFCFRGRVYELGSLSFTFYKEFRFCMYSGVYENEIETFHPINSQVNGTIDGQFHLFNKYP